MPMTDADRQLAVDLARKISDEMAPKVHRALHLFDSHTGGCELLIVIANLMTAVAALAIAGENRDNIPHLMSKDGIRGAGNPELTMKIEFALRLIDQRTRGLIGMPGADTEDREKLYRDVMEVAARAHSKGD